jgi:Tfp pilus assembly protein PilN
MDGTYTTQIVTIPQSIKEVAKLESNRVIANKAKLLFHALSQQNDQQDAILTELAKQKGYKIIQ